MCGRLVDTLDTHRPGLGPRHNRIVLYHFGLFRGRVLVYPVSL